MNWEFKLLDCNGVQGERWDALFNQLPLADQDIHYHPDYARVHERTYNQKVRLVVYGDARNFVMMPVVFRDIAQLDFARGKIKVDTRYSIESLYGFGGPLFQSSDLHIELELSFQFWRQFENYCLGAGIVDEFARLHPLFLHPRGALQAIGVSLKEIKPVVVLDLSQPETAWGIRKGHKSAIKKATREGVEVSRSTATGASLEQFQRLYAGTMERNNAGQMWRFENDYFEQCRECLGDARVSLFSACYESETIASCMILHAYQTAYYHFAASNETAFELGANHFLLYRVAEWCRAQGFHWFFLGGGYSAEDGVYRFKAGFTSKRATLYSYTRIHNTEEYARLCELRADWDLEHNRPGTQSTFFPAYRR